MTDTITKRLAEIRANDYRRDRNGAAAFRQSDLAAVDVPALLAAVEKVHEWTTSDVVTAKSSFGDGYREAMRDIRDLLAAALETRGDEA